ncbi:class II fructose-bisphosphate aldolase [Halosimplex litoreum]|uniref:fructose-bisphosphate aldolase n=1 Tax=Halosimplex litoreum TaxID=1198301 RepID=A0A7T3KVM1_9EURY|nr:class II fructose-bisphosphate aldolase [Halosimplex litoreum]QPV63279.1 class II fructose-bisphosphate aldolase [Halosimplex litoreum]
MPYKDGAALSSVYAAAREAGYGFFASNVTQLDILVGLLRGADRVGADAVFQVSRESAAFYGDGDPAVGLDAFGAYLERFAERTDVGVFCNVDHVRLPDQRDFLDTVVGTGVASSVMVDASDRPFEENVDLVSEAVERVRESERETLVEAELGRVAGTESGVETAAEDAFYTDPEQAVEFVERTGVDLLAISVGTQHGVASGVDLDVRPDVAQEVDDALREAGHDIPLVVHGASGLSDEQIASFLDAGVPKFNKNTRYQYEYARTAADFYHEHDDAVRPPEGAADDRGSMFSGAEWSPDKTYFHPHVVGGEVRDRLADVMADLAEVTGCAGESLYAER